jgi:hypothetical protein
MYKLIIPATIAATLALAPAAFAANTPAASTATTQTAAAKEKHDACMKQWRAEKKHSGTQKAFLAACEKKG